MKAHITLVALAAVIRASTVHAQAVDPIAHLRRGVELRQQGHDDEAGVEFQAAYDAIHTPVAAGQLGFAEQALGQWIAAEGHVREAMAAADDDWVRRNRAALEGSLAVIEQHVGRLEVRGGPIGAEVAIDGVSVATLPMGEPVSVVAGTVHLEVRAQGYAATERSVQIEAGELARESVELRPVPPEVVANQIPGSVGGSHLPIARRTRPNPTWRVLGWTATGVGAVLVVGGVVLNVLREINAADYNNRCPGDATDVNYSWCAVDRSNVNVATGLAIATYALGGALTLAGITVLIVAPPQSRRARAAARVSCRGGPGAVGVSCGGTF